MMSTFEEIFGTIRSLVHAPDCLIADTLATFMDKLHALDAQRCIDEACPYVQGALEHRPTSRLERDFLFPDPMTWQIHIPSLFNHCVSWPVEEDELERYIHSYPAHTLELIVEEGDVQHFSALVKKPWIHQVWGLCFFEELTPEHIDIIEKQPEWPNLTQLILLNNAPLSMFERLTSTSMFQHLKTLEIYLEGIQEPWSDDHTACLNNLKNLHTISFDCRVDQSISLKPLANHPNIENIQALSFNDAANIETLFETTTPHLHTLHLRGGQYDAQLTNITKTIRAPKLKDLSLMYDVKPDILRRAIEALVTPFLTKIEINHTHIELNIIDTLNRSGALKTLEHIYLVGCSIDTVTAACLFEHLSGEHNHIDLNNNDIHARALTALVENAAIQSLHQLKLSNNPVQNGVGALLGKASWLHTLNKIELTETQLNDPEFGTFLTHPALTDLRHVDLLVNHLDDDFCHALTQREPAWRDLYLRLYDNRIGPKGWKMLASWPGLQHIDTLNIGGNTFDMESLRALGDSPYIASIQHLRLGPLSEAHQQVVRDAKHFNAETKGAYL